MIYNALIPDNYEETMQEAQTAFEAIDEDVEALDQKLFEEMQNIEQIEESVIPDKQTEEENYEEVNENDKGGEKYMDNEDMYQ